MPLPTHRRLLIQPKVTGNLVFIMLPPLSHWEMFSAYVLALAMVRGLVVGLGVFGDSLVRICSLPRRFDRFVCIPQCRRAWHHGFDCRRIWAREIGSAMHSKIL